LPTNRDDTQLQHEIEQLLENSVYLDDFDIDVVVENQVVTLRGTVATAAQKDHASRTAEILGILRVDADQIAVDPELGDGSRRKARYANVSDKSVKRAVRRVFHADPSVFSHAEDIDVRVNDGVVVLSGTVNRLRVKRAAERIAMDVIGVRRVVNELKVDYPSGSPSDMEIIRNTQMALHRSPYLERRDFRVHSQAAHVRLYGVVESDLEKQVASWVAEGVEGVVHVANSLAVQREWKEKADEAILSDLERKLKFALFDKSNDIDVTVKNGVAMLRGEVDTWRQWQKALDLAIEAGSRHPHNLINVRLHPPHGSSRIYVPE
jgi:osmotically-inducible protein OsmY